MLSDEKKARIESLSTDEMLCEINRDRQSRFQREAFSHLKTCYEQRLNENKFQTPSQTNNNSETDNNWHNKPVGIIGIGVLIIILGAIAIWALNQYFNLGL